MAGGISTKAMSELLRALRPRYRESTKREKSKILDEFVAVTKCHRKHVVRLLRSRNDESAEKPATTGRRIYDEAVREALIITWEASDRICGKRLKAILPILLDSMEHHGHIDLDPLVRDRLLKVSPATIDRLLSPVRVEAGRRRRRPARKKVSSQIPIRTFADWNQPLPGYLEIDFVAHHGGSMAGSFIHSLVATDVCSGWTEAIPLPCQGTVARGGRNRSYRPTATGTHPGNRHRQRQRLYQRDTPNSLPACEDRVHAVETVSEKRPGLDRTKERFGNPPLHRI